MFKQPRAQLARASRGSTLSSASTNSSIVESEVAEVEMLLEAYFMHYDNTFNRLQVRYRGGCAGGGTRAPSLPTALGGPRGAEGGAAQQLAPNLTSATS